MTDDEDQSNYDVFRDCIAGPMVQRLLTRSAEPVKKKSARSRKATARSVVLVEEEVRNDTEDLTDFVDVKASDEHFLRSSLRARST